jgi:hypothetical protein
MSSVSLLDEPFNPRRHLRTRLLVVVGAIALVAALLQSGIIGWQAIEQVKADRGALLAEVAHQMAAEMDHMVYERLREIQTVASLALFSDPKTSLAEKQAMLETLQANFTHYAWIGLTDEKGNILAGTGGHLVGKNVAQRYWFMHGSTAPYVGDVHDAFLLAKLLPKPKHDFLPLRLLDISAPIRDASGRLVGVLCGHVSWDWSFELRNQILAPLADLKGIDVLILSQEIGRASCRERVS